MKGLSSSSRVCPSFVCMAPWKCHTFLHPAGFHTIYRYSAIIRYGYTTSGPSNRGKGGRDVCDTLFSHKRKVKPFEAILGGHDYHPGEGITRSATLFTSFPQKQTINNLHQTDPRLLSAPRTIARSEEHLGLVFV